MLELSSIRKNKVNLADYHFQQDIDRRILLSDFSVFELEVLEEILFNPLKISIKKLCRAVSSTEEETRPILNKLANTGLVQIQDDTLLVDKDSRKYFEFQINRFDEQFSPNMEFLQGLLKLLPIHILPMWYAVPRSTNNIFESIVEKYLLTPQIFHRYLQELNFSDPILNGIVQDVYASAEYRISSSDLIARYNLSRYDFEQAMLQLEFYFVCFVSYSREEDHWQEWVTPIHEWREYLLFQKNTQPQVIQKTVIRKSDDFTFVKDMNSLLQLAKKKVLAVDLESTQSIRSFARHLSLPFQSDEEIETAKRYLHQLIHKITIIKLAEKDRDRLILTDSAQDWMKMELEDKALFLYRHPLNRVNDSDLCSEKNLREVEKSVKRVLHGGWIQFDDFIPGAIISLRDEFTVSLKKFGKQWRYVLPQYSQEEICFIKAVIFEWLFECGIVSIGKSHDGNDCFQVTPFGQYFLED